MSEVSDGMAGLLLMAMLGGGRRRRFATHASKVASCVALGFRTRTSRYRATIVLGSPSFCVTPGHNRQRERHPLSKVGVDMLLSDKAIFPLRLLKKPMSFMGTA